MESLGLLIKQELKEQGRTVAWLAVRLSCNRANVYNIFLRDNIDVQLLLKISKILKRNFFESIYKEVEEDIRNI